MIDGGRPHARASRRTIPWGLIGMVGLVIAIETTLTRHDLDFTAVWHWDWRLGGRAAMRPSLVRDRELLFFGDSLIKFALIPRVFHEVTGWTARNFALQSGQTTSSFFMLQRTLKIGARPSAIVLDVTPHMLIQPPDQNATLWSELLSTEECLDFAINRQDAAFFFRTMMEKALPSLRERVEIRSNLLAALDGTSSSKRYQIPCFRRNWQVNDGAQVMGGFGDPSADQSELVTCLYSKWDPNALNVIYLDRFLQLAADHQLPVYWLLTALHPDVEADVTDNLFNLNYSNFVQATRSKFPGLFVIDARDSTLPREFYLDGVHLNRTGAIKLSAAVAEVIRERAGSQSSGGWVYIDAKRSLDYVLPIEDVEQSSLVIRAESKKVRR